MYANIKNFITTFYTRKKLGYLKNPYGNTDEKFLSYWNDIHYRLHNHLKWQIKILYPEATLHVITNEKFSNVKNVKYYNFDIYDSHIIKIYMYGLLTEPSVYLDSDIILFDKFKINDLPDKNDFNLYWHINMNLQQLSKQILPIKTEKLYNAGIVFISNPKKELTEKLFEIYYKYFESDTGTTTDETAISYYIESKNLKMIESNRVNVQKSLCESNFNSMQSVHYTGFFLRQKLSFFNDFKISPTYKKITSY